MAVNARTSIKEYKNPSYRKPGRHFEEKKHTLVIDAQGASNKEVRTESGTIKFQNGVAMLPHDSRARDIVDEMNVTEARHPQQYALLENRGTVNTDPIHRMRITSPGMPWATYDELGRRVKDLQEDSNARVRNESDAECSTCVVRS